MSRDHDGVDDICYRTGSEAAFEFTTSESYTFACWVRHDSLTGYQRYITKGTPGGSNTYFFGKAGTINVLDFGVEATTYLVGTTALSANTWYFVAAVRDVGADQFRVYLATASGDVGLESSATDLSTGTHGTVATGLGIGRNTDAGVEPMNGRIAEVYIWNRALTVNELRAVKWHQYLDKAGLLAYWPLWGVADPEPDLSGNGRHLAVFGAVRADHAPIGPYAPFAIDQWWSAFVEAVIAKNVSDTLSVSLTEAAALFVPISVADTLTASISEASAVLVSVNVADTLSVSVSESSSLTAFLAVADTLGISLQEAVALAVTVAVADTLSISLTEAAQVVMALSVIDTLSVSLSETGSVVIITGGLPVKGPTRASVVNPGSRATVLSNRSKAVPT